MLSVVREVAEEAERRANGREPLGELLVELVRSGEEAVARTPEQLDVLREAGVVDAGGAGLVELLRGVAAAVAGIPVPEASEVANETAGVDAIHLEPSRYRYCTVFVVEGDDLDREALEAQLEPLGDSLLVVGDASALKVHVHTDEPGAALSLGTAVGTIDGVEIANMHEQQEQRERRLSVVPDVERAVCGVVAVLTGEGNRTLFESLAEPVGPLRIVEGGQTANPSTAELLAAIEELDADEAILLPNNGNVRLAAEQAARNAGKPVELVPTDSIPAGLGALVSFDGSRTAAENAEEMREALAAVAAGEVTRASRDVRLSGVEIRSGDWLGLANGEPVAGGEDFTDVAAAVVDKLLDDRHSLLTLLTGAEPEPLDDLLAGIAASHPGVEVEVHDGGQPHYPLLLGAE